MWSFDRGSGSTYQLLRRQVGQPLVDEGGLLIADHLLAAAVADHQLRPRGPLGALLQRHLQAEHGKKNRAVFTKITDELTFDPG